MGLQPNDYRRNTHAAAVAIVAMSLSSCGSENGTVTPELDPDIHPPEVVSTLMATDPTDSSLTLEWEQPQDGPSRYQIYYTKVLEDLLSDGGLSRCTSLDHIAEPEVFLQRVTMSLNSGTEYHFILRGADESGNLSAFSNIATNRTYQEIPKLQREWDAPLVVDMVPLPRLDNRPLLLCLTPDSVVTYDYLGARIEAWRWDYGRGDGRLIANDEYRTYIAGYDSIYTFVGRSMVGAWKTGGEIRRFDAGGGRIYVRTSSPLYGAQIEVYDSDGLALAKWGYESVGSLRFIREVEVRWPYVYYVAPGAITTMTLAGDTIREHFFQVEGDRAALWYPTGLDPLDEVKLITASAHMLWRYTETGTLETAWTVGNDVVVQGTPVYFHRDWAYILLRDVFGGPETTRISVWSVRDAIPEAR